MNVRIKGVALTGDGSSGCVQMKPGGSKVVYLRASGTWDVTEVYDACKAGGFKPGLTEGTGFALKAYPTTVVISGRLVKLKDQGLELRPPTTPASSTTPLVQVIMLREDWSAMWPLPFNRQDLERLLASLSSYFLVSDKTTKARGATSSDPGRKPTYATKKSMTAFEVALLGIAGVLFLYVISKWMYEVYLERTKIIS